MSFEYYDNLRMQFSVSNAFLRCRPINMVLRDLLAIIITIHVIMWEKLINTIS